MVAWSSPIIRNTLIARCRNLALLPKYNGAHCKGLNHLQVRTCKGHSGVFHIVPSNFHWNKLKDMLHFYLMIGLIPALAVILYCNIFIGPATLRPIPEGYKPKTWEYHSHPITRFICQYITDEPQKVYEKMCHFIYYTQERRLIREIEQRVKYLISDRRDFQSWYYTPAMTKYTKRRAKELEEWYESSLNSEFPLRV